MEEVEDDYFDVSDEEVADPDDDATMDEPAPAAPSKRRSSAEAFASFRKTRPESDSLGPAFDMQVVDIECQLRPRNAMRDDPDVLSSVRLADMAQDEVEEEGTEDYGFKRKRREYSAANPWNWSVPCMRIYGKLATGHSVCVNTYGFYPIVHLLISCVPSAAVVRELSERTEAALRAADTKQKTRNGSSAKPKNFRYILAYRTRMGYPAYPYVADPICFIEFKLAFPTLTRVFSDYYQNNPTTYLDCVGGEVNTAPYSCLDIVEQFQAQRRIAGFGWVHVRPCGITVKGEDNRVANSYCDYEFDAGLHDVETMQNDDVAPLRVFTYDIECLRTKGMPKPENDAVILIACVCTDYEKGMPVPERTRRVILQYRSALPLPKEQIDEARGDVHMCFTTEEELLDCFGLLVRNYDPDFIVGHNIVNFDTPYVVKRSNVLGERVAQNLGRRALYWGRWSPPREIHKKRKNGETRITTITDTPGRIQLDTLPWIMAIRPLRSYRLGYLSNMYLGDTKADVPYQLINPLWKTSDETRRRLAIYNLKDSVLTAGLCEHKEFAMVISCVEMSRQMRMCAGKLLRSGAQAKVFGNVLEIACAPGFDKDNNPVFFPSERPKTRGKDDKYGGATVLEVSRGFYKDPLFCADFRSLYPSIMLDLNIDWSTVVLMAKYDDLVGKVSPNGVKFVKPEVRMGIIPQMEAKLFAARDAAKAAMKSAKDKDTAKLYDTRQNQIKLIMNSTYGILGASGGRITREELALAVTSQGRRMIAKAKEVAEQAFRAKVVAGDTDSIMVKFPEVKTVIEGFPLLVQLCDTVTKAFAPSYIMLQAEKAMAKALMVNKKRYVYMCMMGPTAPAKLAFKGVEMARRDNCLMVVELMSAVIEELMESGDVKKARAHVDKALRDLMAGKVDISKLVITKSITKEDYKADPVQLIVARRMAARDPSYEYGVGERIPYVIVKRPGKVEADKAEDPLWAITHGMQIDETYYLEHQLSAPIARILMWAMMPSDERKVVEVHEDAIRTAEDRNEGVQEAHKRLDKLLDKMGDKYREILFGAGALAACPRKVTHSKQGIGAFFSPKKKCPVCNSELDDPKKPCPSCTNPKCPNCNGGTHKYGQVCKACAEKFHPCPECGRLTSNGPEPLCFNCALGLCGMCGNPVEGSKLCPRCAEFEGKRAANKAAMRTEDVEDLVAIAAELKNKCDECRGYPSEEINCVARDCPTLYKRATVATKLLK